VLEVETELNAAKIGWARVFNTRDQYEDAHYAAREMTVPVLDRQSGVPIRVYGVVPKMSLTPGRIWRGAPSIGDDTTDILAHMLGMSEGAIDKLYADGVMHRTEPFTEPRSPRSTPSRSRTALSGSASGHSSAGRRPQLTGFLFAK
jgi:CoA-transferase family III